MESEKKMKEDFKKRGVKEKSKKPYVSPRLTVHGTVKESTKSLLMGPTDGMTGSQSIPSDRNLKENFAEVEAHKILTHLMDLPIQTWNYKAEDPSIRHIGPMAQDFARAFGVGEDDRHIHPIDATGIAFAAIQALYQLIQNKEKEILRLQTELEELKRTSLTDIRIF